MPARCSLLVLLGAGAGLRQGEAFGLALDHIDLTAGMITIDQQVVIVDRRPVLAPPKTSASFRDILMPVSTAVIDHCGRYGSLVLGCCAALTAAACCAATTSTVKSGSPQ